MSEGPCSQLCAARVATSALAHRRAAAAAAPYVELLLLLLLLLLPPAAGMAYCRRLRLLPGLLVESREMRDMAG